jgi:Ca-activated chloride channel homolog
MFNPRGFENSRPDGFGVLEAVGEGAGDQPRRFVPLKRTELRGELAGPLAPLRLTQVFGYSASDCAKTLEAVYRFPLPGDAAVTAVRVRFGDVTIRATLGDRRQAEADYEKARQEGRQAAIATRESPDVFTLQVAGLQPDQAVTVETTFVLLARAEGAGWSLRIPLTTAPRYVRSDEAGSRAAEGQPLAVLRDPGHRFTMDLGLRGTDSAESSTHRLALTREGGQRRVRLADGEVVPDRDLLLSWKPEGAGDRPSLGVVRHDDPASGHAYFLAMVAPPATRDPGHGLAREVILLVDHSGSMSGAKWQAADWAVERFLTDLTDRDRFAFGLFHDTTRWFSKAPRTANQKDVEEAIAFLKANRDSGGTELGVALEQALGQARTEGESARHVLIVTDAEVSDAGRLLMLADQESRRADRRRVSVLCIDAAPNSFLALELAERGGGVARFLTSDPSQQDIASALDHVLDDWAEPVLAGLRLEVDRPDVRGSGRLSVDVGRTGWSGVDLGDLPAGRSLWVVGRAPLGEAGSMNFRLATARGHELAAIQLPPSGETPEGTAIKALFGVRQILGLENLIQTGSRGDELRDGLRRLGYDPQPILDGPSKVYPENADAALRDRLRDLLVRESLAHGLACSETAFFAERTEVGKVVEGRVLVASGLPAGWSDDASLCLSVDSMLMAMPASPMGLTAPPIKALLAHPGGGRSSTPRKYAMPFARAMAPAGAMPSPTAMPRQDAGGPGPTVVFRGSAVTTGGEAVLFDTTRSQDSAVVPGAASLKGLTLKFPDGAVDHRAIDGGLALLIFVDDLTEPRARVRLTDLIRQHGERPLNLSRSSGQVVRVVLVDPSGAWAKGSPRFELSLAW